MKLNLEMLSFLFWNLDMLDSLMNLEKYTYFIYRLCNEMMQNPDVLGSLVNLETILIPYNMLGLVLMRLINYLTRLR